VRAASTNTKFDPTVLARPAHCGGSAQMQALLILPLGPFEDKQWRAFPATMAI
jgi:hypothetical protein